MSLNPAADSLDRNDLKTADFIFAGIVHLLVIVLIMLLSWWQSRSEPEPLKRIEVEMISAKELAKLQQPKAAARKKKSATQSEPVLKFQAKPSKPVKAAEDDFDPFAPVQSQSDIATPAKQGRNEMADIMGKQLSQQEIDRYIAMMQQAVQQRWKVPAGVDSGTPDPLVEMVLNRNGSVASARIIESSGNAPLDQTLISAIYAAAPFQVPDRQFEAFRVNQIRFRPLK